MAHAIGIDPGHVLLNSSHTHAAPWPGATQKLGGETDGWTERERRYWASLPDAFASVAVMAAASAREARISGAVGHAPGLAVNRRERTADGRTILGWNPEGFVDDAVPTLRIDGIDGEAIATLVGFGCHPVVVGPEVDAVGSDFVGPLRRQVEALRGGVAVFLQGAAGNVLPLEGFFDHAGPEVVMGERLGLEAAHAVADRDPRVTSISKVDFGSVTPISLYRRTAAAEQPRQPVAVARRVADPSAPGAAVARRARSRAAGAHDRAAQAPDGRCRPQRHQPDRLPRELAAIDARRVGTRAAARDGDRRGVGGAPRRLRHRGHTR